MGVLTILLLVKHSSKDRHTRLMERLHSRMTQLEMELCSSQRRTGDTRRRQHRSERTLMELQGQRYEEQRNMGRMEDLVSALEKQCSNYKKQIQEAEEIAALNLASGQV